MEQIYLMIMPLNAIEEEQEKILSGIQGAKPIVLNKDTNNQSTQRKIGRGEYTHGRIR